MKKNRDGKQNKRNPTHIFKYANPQPSQPLQQSKIHSRSLIELDENTSRYQQSARMPSGRDAHHSSLCASNAVEVDTVKSNSLKKFLSIFGGPAHLNQNSMGRSSARGDDRANKKGSSRQVFTCNIKNMNVNVNAGKDKDYKQNNNSLLVLKRDKAENNKSVVSHCSLAKDQDEQSIIMDLRKSIEEGRERQGLLKKQIEQYQRENSMLKIQKEAIFDEMKQLEEVYLGKEKQLNKKMEQMQKLLANKDKCRQHDLVIQSLKKVINQQLRKIIELQKSKIEREEIQKLQERINKNITIANESTLKEKLKMIEGTAKSVGIKRKEAKMIKVQEQHFDSAVSSPSRQLQTYQDVIEEATEQQERGSQCKMMQSQQDSILDQVDKYLAKWRLKP